MTCPVSFFMSKYHDLGGRWNCPSPLDIVPDKPLIMVPRIITTSSRLHAPKYCCPKAPRGWEVWLWPEVQAAHWGQGERPLLRPRMQLEPSIPFWGGWLGLWLSWIRHSALMLYAVSTHLLEIKTINPFWIRKIGEGQLPSLIILNIRKFIKKCSFSSYGKQYDSFSHR